MMKKTMMVVAVAAVAASVLADGKTAVDREALMARRKAHFERVYGGWHVIREPDSKPFAFVNCQTKVPEAAFRRPLARMTRFLSVDLTMKAGTWDGEHGESGTVYIIDDPAKPMSGIFPEAGWGYMNVAKLGEKDDPKLAERAGKELWRVLGYVGGAISSNSERCLLNPIFSAEDIDKYNLDTISPEPVMRMPEYLNALGVKRFRRISYRDACLQGIAPAPTNENQRVVWEKVKAEQAEKPSNALTIKPGDKPLQK